MKLIYICIFCMAVWGCGVKAPAGLPQKTEAVGTSVNNEAVKIDEAVTEGESKAPDLQPIWNRIKASTAVIKEEAKKIFLIAKEEKKLVQTNSNLVKDLENEKSELKDNLNKVTIFALILVGIAVAAGVWLGRWKIAVAVAAGAVAIFIGALAFKALLTIIPIAVGIILAVCVLWIAVESILRKSIYKALKTSPMQDIKDMGGK